MVLLNFRLFPLGAQPTFLLLKDSCQRVQDVWRRLTRRPTDFDPRSGYFDADGVAAQLIAVFGESSGEVAHGVCRQYFQNQPNRGPQSGPICAAILFPSRYTVIVCVPRAPPGREYLFFRDRRSGVLTFTGASGGIGKRVVGEQSSKRVPRSWL